MILICRSKEKGTQAYSFLLMHLRKLVSHSNLCCMCVCVRPPKVRSACTGSGDLPGCASWGQVTGGQCGRSKGPFFFWKKKETTRVRTRRTLTQIFPPVR